VNMEIFDLSDDDAPAERCTLCIDRGRCDILSTSAPRPVVNGMSEQEVCRRVLLHDRLLASLKKMAAGYDTADGASLDDIQEAGALIREAEES
jgi:hypothetical protein